MHWLITKDCFSSYDTVFAIQAISRFAVAYLLTERGALAPGAAVLSVADQGQSFDDLSVDDLSLARHLATGISPTTMFRDQSKRDSSVLDAFHEVCWHLDFCASRSATKLRQRN